mgnify:CR=1 FL=1
MRGALRGTAAFCLFLSLNAAFAQSGQGQSTTTGLSQCTLSTTLVGAGNSAQMLIRDLAPYPDNAWGDSYTVVRVTINESQFNASVNAI